MRLITISALAVVGSIAAAGSDRPGIWPVIVLERGERGVDTNWSRTRIAGCLVTNAAGETNEDGDFAWHLSLHVGSVDWDNPVGAEGLLMPRDGVRAPQFTALVTDPSEKFRMETGPQRGFVCGEDQCTLHANYSEQPMDSGLTFLLTGLVGGASNFNSFTTECMAALDKQGAANGN